MNRATSPSQKVSITRRGYTLFEVLLALGLSGLLMLVVYAAMQTFWQLDTAGRIDAKHCQLARTLIRRMEMDIRSLTYKPAEQQMTDSDEQAAEEGAGNTSEDDAETETDSTTIRVIEDESTLTANVHLIGTSQSLEMIVLRPTRNRTGGLEEDLFQDRESDRRKVGYLFSAGMGESAGLFYRNNDQLFESLQEQEGALLDPTSQYQLLAAEVADMRFQYLDGGTNTWVDEWHSRDLAGLPRAIKITIQFHSEAMASTNLLRQSRTSGSTQVFQTVVHLPLSDVPLEL